MNAVLTDFRLLRLLDRLYSTGHISLSAEQLDMSQPSASIALARARKALGDPLFVRTRQGMQPTPRMDEMIAGVREVLTGLNQLTRARAPFDAATSQRQFRIFMTDASHVTLMPRLFGHIHALAPGVGVEAASIGPGMAEALEDGEADLALGLIPDLETGIMQQALFDQDWVCLCNARHPRLGQATRLSVAQYRKESHVGIVRGTGQALLEEALSAQGIERQVLLRLPGFLGLPAILTATDLVATLPRHIGETLASLVGLKVLPCPARIPGFTVKQYWHTRYHHDSANQWLRSVVADLFLRSRQQLRA
jgi:DNA-binding transcriptional LysR family regulator